MLIYLTHVFTTHKNDNHIQELELDPTSFLKPIATGPTNILVFNPFEVANKQCHVLWARIRKLHLRELYMVAHSALSGTEKTILSIDKKP